MTVVFAHLASILLMATLTDDMQHTQSLLKLQC